MKKILLILTAVLSLSVAADAKWWIFGKSNDEVGLKYLYVNKVSSEEAGPKIKIFKETLGTDGLVKINGKAAVGKGGVGSVRISLDDKATWQDVKFADNGTFEYSFKPEQAKTYAMLVEVTDTAGKTNKVEDTRKEITLSDENIQAKVRETLDAMFAAYNAENLQKFMGYVGENFAGDKAILERAVKRDFDALSSINLRYTVNNISAGAQGRVFVSVTYNRMVLVNKAGTTSQDTGATEFVFDSKEGKLSLFSMKQPLMFGLSDAENVATGSALGDGTPLVLDDSGTLGGAGTQVTIACASGQVPAYEFANGAKACSPGGGMNIWFYPDSNPDLIGLVTTKARTFPSPLAALGSSEVKNLAGYTDQPTVADAGSGSSYCFNYGTDFYCLEMLSAPTTATSTASFRVKKF
jgi:hypothetical protein